MKNKIYICRGWNNEKKITLVLLQGFYAIRCISSLYYTSLGDALFFFQTKVHAHSKRQKVEWRAGVNETDIINDRQYVIIINIYTFVLTIISLSKIFISLLFFWIYYYVVHIILHLQYLIINMVVLRYFVTWQFLSTLDNQQICYHEICYNKSKSWKRNLS